MSGLIPEHKNTYPFMRYNLVYLVLKLFHKIKDIVF